MSTPTRTVKTLLREIHEHIDGIEEAQALSVHATHFTVGQRVRLSPLGARRKMHGRGGVSKGVVTRVDDHGPWGLYVLMDSRTQSRSYLAGFWMPDVDSPSDPQFLHPRAS